MVAYSQAGSFPTASSWVGHGIGIAGFVLMLLTATLYPLRKLRTDASWGSTASWLKVHMVTGLVGPYMVLLHTAMRFHGLAGLTMLLTVLVVASGLVGRFLYTRVPRSPEAAGATPRLRDLARHPPAAHLGAVRRRDRPRRRGSLLRDAAAVTK